MLSKLEINLIYPNAKLLFENPISFSMLRFFFCI